VKLCCEGCVNYRIGWSTWIERKKDIFTWNQNLMQTSFPILDFLFLVLRANVKLKSSHGRASSLRKFQTSFSFIYIDMLVQTDLPPNEITTCSGRVPTCTRSCRPRWDFLWLCMRLHVTANRKAAFTIEL